MEEYKSKIIFKIKEGVSVSELLPKAQNELNAVNLRIGRLYDISDEVASFRANSILPSGGASDEEIFVSDIYGTKSEAEQALFRTYYAEGEREQTEFLYDSLKADDNIEFVQYDEMNGLHGIPNDQFFNQQWALSKINCPGAWELTSGQNIVVAVIDSGVDYNHPDIRANMWTDADGSHGRDFSDGDNNPLDYHGHGTHCAGIVAASTDNGIGVAGVAPRVRVMALKISPHLTDSAAAAAIKYAADKGARVLNNSWGPINGRRPSNLVVEDAINYALQRGCIVVCSAGNNNDDVRFYSPANHPNVISVASTDANDARASDSNFGAAITIAAPGVGILSLRIGTSQYISMSGTSMACPHVSGLVALLLSLSNNLTPNQIKQILRNSGDAIQTDKPVGGRRINSARAVQTLA